MTEKMTLVKLRKLKQMGEKIVALTAYDAAMAYWEAEAGVEVILVGDSLGMVVQGHDTTLPVTLDEMVYHTKLVQRKNHQAWCIADLPFMADQNLTTALDSAARLMKEGLANMVKLEGGQRALSIVQALSEIGIPVCGHLGLLPQSVEKKGYQVVGKVQEEAERVLADALALEAAGAEMLVLECVPVSLAKKISEALAIPVIGIGAGPETDGQVLVITDLLGTTVGRLPKFSKNYLTQADSIQTAIGAYVSEVKAQVFPAQCHCLAE